MQIKFAVRLLPVLLAATTSACEAQRATAATSSASVTPAGTPAATFRTSGATKPTIVLVHGAFADASGWYQVMPALQDRGFNVIAVQNPLTGLAADIESTRRVIEAQPGNVILVGHSYGGAVISGASAGSTKVKALVFIAAFAPDANEPVGAVGTQFPPPALLSALHPDAAGFVYIDTAKYRDVFAQDVPQKQTRWLAAAQKPIEGTTFGQSAPGAGWRTIPSWYLVAQRDRTINPDVERFYAKRMNATVTEANSDHVPFLSQPMTVVKLILDAAASVEK